MADSLNPEDKAQLSRLEQGLSKLEGDLGKRLETLRRGLAADQQKVTREVSRGAHEELVRRQGGQIRTTLPTEAEVRRYGQAEVAAGEAVDRRAQQFQRISRLNLQTSQEQLNVMGRTEQLIRLERNLGLERARNLQIIQRQAQQLGVALPGQVTSGRNVRAAESAFRPPAPAIILPTTGQAATAEDRLRGQLQRASQALAQLRAGGGPDLLVGGGGGGIPPRRPTAGGMSDPDEERRRNLRKIMEANKLVKDAQQQEVKQTAEQIEAHQKLSAAMQKSGASMQQMEARVSEASRTLAIGSNALRAHGALTTEFITAAAKGQTTFSELGFQVGATIGKFAGWTGAAAAVYGVLGAVTALGSGATESLQGVNLLQRVVNNLDTDKAQKDFRALSQEFNLPIDEVVRTSYEASKAFKTQADALDATRAALFGVKVGELDAAKAGQFATAVARGFHLEAKQLGDVIDTVNALQNQFGGNFGSIAQGMAAAAGAFGAARGNYQQLAAAIATVSQTTGIQGPNAATALRRTSELAFRPERRGNILDVLGIDTRDATTSISDLLDAAMKKVEEGANPLEIAKLITTPELASRAIAPLLASGPLYRQRLAVAEDPGPSSARELARAKQSIRDQLSMVGNELQQIGSNLAQSGGLNIFGGMLKTINESLHLANQLLEVFNSFPKPVREAAVYLGQAAAALAILRRAGVGGTLAPRFPFLGEQLSRRSIPQSRAQMLQGLGDERGWLRDQAQAVGRQRALAELEATQAAVRHDRNVDLHGAGRLSDDELVASAARRDANAAQAEVLAQKQADIQARQTENLRQENALRERTNFRNRKNIKSLEDLDKIAKDEGILWTNPTLEKGVPLSAVPVGTRAAAPSGKAPVPEPPAVDPQAQTRRAASSARLAETERQAERDAANAELATAQKRARFATMQRERFDRESGLTGTTRLEDLSHAQRAEREALINEQQRTRGEREGAAQRARDVERGVRPGPPSQAIRGPLSEWAHQSAIGEPIPMPAVVPPAVVPPGDSAEERVQENTRKAEDLSRKQNSLRDNIAKQTAISRKLTGEFSKTGEAMPRLSQAMGMVGGGVQTFGQGAKNVGTGLAAFGRNLAAAIDPITGILAGFLIVEASYSYVRNKVQETNRKVASLRAVGTASPESIRTESNRELGQRSAFEAVQDAYASVHNALTHIPLVGGDRISSPNQQRDAAARAAKQYADQIEKGNQVGLYLTRGEINARLNENLRKAGDDKGKVGAAFAQAQKESQNARGLYFGSGADGAPTGAEAARAAKNMEQFRASLKARLAGLKSISESVSEALKLATDGDTLGAILQSEQTNIGLYGFNDKRAGDLGKTRARAVEILSRLNRGDPNYEAERQKQLQVIQATSQTATQEANDRLSRSLPYVDPEVAARLRQTQIQRVRRTLVGGTEDKIAELQRKIASRTGQIKVAGLEALPGLTALPGGDPAGPAGALGQASVEEQKKQAHYRALKEAQKQDKAALEKLRKELKLSKDEFKAFVREQEKAQFEAEQAAFDATTNLLQSRTPDQSADLAIAAQRAQQAYNAAKAYRAAHGGPRSIVQNAEAKRNEANQQVALDAIRDAQANDQLSTSRAEAGGLKDKGLLQRQLADAKRNAGRVKAAVDAGKVDPDAYRDALQNVYQAQIALNNFIQSNTDSLLNALEALALSKTEDPNKQAKIRVDYARKRLAEALKTGTKDQQITAQADLNQRIREKRNTAQQGRFDDIEFMASMGEIGKQTEISMLNQLLTTMHGNRELRRTIKQRIHDLQASTNDLTSDDLTLGNIKLPTPYEVNRAIKEGGRAARGGHTFNTRAEVNVFVARSEDAPAVAAAIDSTLNTHVRSVLRTRTG